MPKIYTMHCPLSLGLVVETNLLNNATASSIGGRALELDPQGVVLSERSTPFSRANCSNVMGMKEPKVLGD